jgi:signal transduction histidine kinase
MKASESRPGTRLRRWFRDPTVKVTAILLAALIIINAAAVWGIVSSRLGAESLALQDLRLQTMAHARSLEAVLSSRRGDFIFLSQSPPLAEAPSSLASRDPVSRRWGRLDIEGSLLFFLAAHPEVERLVIRDSNLHPLVVAGRRDEAPVLFPTQNYMEPASPKEGYLVGSWPLGSASEARGRLEAVLHLEDLLKIAAPGIGPQFELVQQESVDSVDASGRGTVVVSSPVKDQGWPTPVNWALVSRQNPSRLIESVTALEDRYRATVILNLVVIGVAFVLGIVAFQQVRRSAALQAENQQQARVRVLEQQVMHNERLASVGRLAAGMAHEINNPLEGMSNYLSMLETDLNAQRNEAATQLAARLREGLDRVAAIIRQVLTFSDPGAVPHAPLNLNEILEETVRFVQSNPAFRRTELLFRAPDSELRILGNRVTLGQLFLNLLMNASQVQPEGGQIEVAALQDGDKAVVLVADCGPGIPPDVIPRIFEPFYSTRGSTGLGLSVCHGIVSEHRGRIQVTNRPEGGAIFFVEFPIFAGENADEMDSLSTIDETAGGATPA